MSLFYLWSGPHGDLPSIALNEPFRAVVVAELALSPARMDEISEWLIASGCRYVMAWGENASAWDDAADMASMERNRYEDPRPEELVITTWHPGESLAEVFEFSNESAKHPALSLDELVIVHVASEPDADRLLAHLGGADR